MSLKIVFVLTNGADPDEMPLYAAFHLGLHRLQKYPCMGFQSTKGNDGSSLVLSLLIFVVSDILWTFQHPGERGLIM